MRWSAPAVLVGLASSVVLVGSGAVALVRTGTYDAMMDQCSDETHQATDALADEMRRTLPGRSSAVEVEGYCEKEPSPTVLTTTSADRATITRELSARWDCHLSRGSSPPLWVCADVNGYQAQDYVYDDGDVAANVDTLG